MLNLGDEEGQTPVPSAVVRALGSSPTPGVDCDPFEQVVEMLTPQACEQPGGPPSALAHGR